jgi:phage terminase large subunit-like protein
MQIPIEKRLYIGIDLGVVSDRTGFAIAYFDDYYKVGDGYEPKIKVPVALTISRLPGQETSIHKIKDLIFAISNVRDISMVCMDQYQSTQIRQDCNLAKIRAVLSSVDRTTDPYNFLKRMIYMGMVELPKSRILQFELGNLIDTGKKIDHPQYVNSDLSGLGQSGQIGSKDTADAVCNAVFNLFQDLKVADKISGRYNSAAQMDMLDKMGWSGRDSRDAYLGDFIRRARNAS